MLRRLAVCICTYNRDMLLSQLLHSLAAIDWRLGNLAEVVLVVVNNKPNPDTRHICEGLSASLPVYLNYAEEPERGISSARNRAVAEALSLGADLIAFLDDDDMPDPDWLVELLIVHDQTKADIVAGNHRFTDPPPWSDGLDDRRSRKSDSKSVGSAQIPRGARTSNVLIGRAILEKMSHDGGPFRLEFSASGGEDKDFFLRAAQAGALFAFAEESVVNVYHEAVRFTSRGVFARGLKAGCSKMNITHAHGRHNECMVLFVRSLGKFLHSLLSFPLALSSKRKRLRCLYRMGRAAGSVYFFITGHSPRYYLAG